MKFAAVFLAAFLFTLPLQAKEFVGAPVAYFDGATELEGYWSPTQCGNTAAPVVLIIHQWKGLGDYERSRADRLAAQCYNAFAVDMYGKGIRPETREEAGAQAGIYKGDSALARRRIGAALEFARSRENVDGSRIAAIGYCFGGTMALELARSGADVAGVVSFHGGLGSKDPLTAPGAIKASVQIHHGADDPLVPAEEIDGFIKEMNVSEADWSFTSYADAVHSFTEKEAGDDPSSGVAYNEKADQRSWGAALNFLSEVLTPPDAQTQTP